jgi:hypothetical protein
MAKCKKCDYPYAAEGRDCPSCGSRVPARGGYFQHIDFGGENAKQRQESVDSKKVSKEKIKEFTYVGRNLEDLNELFNSQSDDFLFGIEILDLSNNKIKDINPLIRLKPSRDKFPKLRELHLSGNLIEELPEKIIDVFGGSIRILDLSNNKLKSLPSNFDRLFCHNIEEINLSKNYLKSFISTNLAKEELGHNRITLNLAENPIEKVDDNLIKFLRDLSYATTRYLENKGVYDIFLELILPKNLANEHDNLLSFQQEFEDIDFERINCRVEKYNKWSKKTSLLSEINVSNLIDEKSSDALEVLFLYYNNLVYTHGINLSYGKEGETIDMDHSEYFVYDLKSSYFDRNHNLILGKKIIKESKTGGNYDVPYFKNININTLVNHHMKWDIDVLDYVFDIDSNSFKYRKNKSSNSTNDDGSAAKGVLNLIILALLAFGLLYGFYKLITLIF